ncbi:hypothetical protein, partial [Thiomicrospira microaerophila]|uniref:hypothetical protein n=1 Tax=Thiomicrospira microaerophila TaxID=406020 RepID=UPI0005C7EB6C
MIKQNLHPKMKTLVSFISLTFASSLFADTTLQQVITPVGGNEVILTQPLDIELNYSTTDDNNTLSGLGLRLHYNSNLVDVEVIDRLNNGLVMSATMNDTADTDNDATTDKFVLFGWVDLYGNWPNQDLPTGLITVRLTPKEGAEAATNINFSASDTAIGYQLNALPINISFSDNRVIPETPSEPAEGFNFNQGEWTFNNEAFTWQWSAFTQPEQPTTPAEGFNFNQGEWTFNNEAFAWQWSAFTQPTEPTT